MPEKGSQWLVMMRSLASARPHPHRTQRAESGYFSTTEGDLFVWKQTSMVQSVKPQSCKVYKVTEVVFAPIKADWMCEADCLQPMSLNSGDVHLPPIMQRNETLQKSIPALQASVG